MKVKAILNDKTKKIVPMLFIVMLALAGGAAIAIQLLERQVLTSMTITSLKDMGLYDEDHTTILATIAFGEFMRSEMETFPADPGIDWYQVKNLGEENIYIGWSFDGSLPSGVTAEVYVKSGSQGPETFALLAEDAILSMALPPGSFSVDWYIVITATGSAVFGDFNPVLTWSAYDTDSG